MSEDNEEFLISPGEILKSIQMKLPIRASGGIPGVTRSAAQGLAPIHIKELRMLAAALGTDDAALLTATLLRAHGNEGSAEAVAKWKPHVERALRGGDP